MRQPSQEDLDTIFFLRSDQEVNRFIKREPARSIADANDWLERITRAIEENKSFNWAITLFDKGKMVGSVCLWNFSPDRTVAELGYDLHPKFQGKGIMSEAVDAVLEYGFYTLDLKAVVALTSRFNEASIKMLVKKGFILDKDKMDEDNPDNSVYVLETVRPRTRN